ncbi:MAG: hypothetical protein ABJN69_08085 [Hellea sp.]
MPSGKQTLLSLLTEYSQRYSETSDLDEISDRVKAGLLLHGSSSNSMWKAVEDITWKSHCAREDGLTVTEQGLTLEPSGILLTDLFSVISEDETLINHVRKTYPEISPDAFQSALHIIWLLLGSVEWSKAHEEIESKIDVDGAQQKKSLKAYQRKLKEYREDPEDYS